MKIMHLMGWLVLAGSVQTVGATAAASEIESGHSAVWYDPARSGEGWVLEVLDDDRALAYWFTYDEDGHQRWLIGPGNVVSDEDGEFIDIPVLYVTRGGRFGPDFDPDDVIEEAVGSASFRFEGCHQGTVTYDAFGQTGETPLRRLSTTMAAGCQSINGVPGQAAQAYAGQSGSWYDLNHSGEGFSLQWMARDQAIVYWYSYDAEGNQVWMFGIGHEADGQLVIPDMLSTRGAKFGDTFDPADVELFAWGSMSLTLECESGDLAYESPLADFGSGGQGLTRLTRLKDPDCPYVQPTLADLYDIEWVEVPGSADDTTVVRAVGDDGTVVGTRQLGTVNEAEVVVLRPGAADWETLSGQSVWNLGAILTSADGGRVATNEVFNPDDPMPFGPVAWTEGLGWQSPADIVTPFSELRGSSMDLSVLVGRMSDDDGPDFFPWLWDADGGQRQLPTTEEFPHAWAVGASNDGSVVIGGHTLPEIGTPPPGTPSNAQAAIRWVDEGSPEFLADPNGVVLREATACDANCNVVTGKGYSSLVLGEEPPESTEAPPGNAWVWTSEGRFAAIETLYDDPPLILEIHAPAGISADGSLIAGTVERGSSLASPPPADGVFVWTQRSGTHYLVAPDFVVGSATRFELIAEDVSPSGYRILTRAFYSGGGAGGLLSNAWVVKLTPKSAE